MARRVTAICEVTESEIERLKKYRAIAADGCWHWTGAKNQFGYGRLNISRGGSYRTIGAHRLAYMAWIGPLEDGEVVMHTCDNPSCINPSHLRSGSQDDNMKDMHRKGRYRNTRWREPGEARIVDGVLTWVEYD